VFYLSVTSDQRLYEEEAAFDMSRKAKYFGFSYEGDGKGNTC